MFLFDFEATGPRRNTRPRLSREASPPQGRVDAMGARVGRRRARWCGPIRARVGGNVEKWLVEVETIMKSPRRYIDLATDNSSKSSGASGCGTGPAIRFSRSTRSPGSWPWRRP